VEDTDVSDVIDPARRCFGKFIGATLIGATIAFIWQPVTASPDFTGKTVTWIIPFKEGGGSDKWARFYAPPLSQALPGKPLVVVKNIPGAGSTKGANYFASRRVKPDGLTILGTSGSTQFPYLLGDRRVKFDYKDWNVVLASSTGGVVYLPVDLGAKWKADPKSILQTQFIFGSQGVTRLAL
jgi:tripartite-type tricarboxylate transporter receptor subunit TctC